jgi:hypothetical protein
VTEFEVEAEEVRILRLQPGDALVLRFVREISAERARRIKTLMSDQFPGNKILVLSGEVELTVLREEDHEPSTRSGQEGQTPLTSYIDLIDWLKTRGYAQTTGEARRIILARRVRSESHPLGVRKVSQLSAQGKVEDVEVVDPYVPAELRPTLRVEPK